MKRKLRKNKRDLEDQILSTFSSQFAENQRILEQSFLKILGYLGFVLMGYTYVFYRTQSNEPMELTLIAVLSEILIAFGALIVLSTAFNFRRDQTMISKIRDYAGITGHSKIFPDSCDPRKSISMKDFRKWVPNYLDNFFYVFIITIAILLISFAVKFNLSLSLCDVDWMLTSPLLIGIVSYFIIIRAYFSYYFKIRNFIIDNSDCEFSDIIEKNIDKTTSIKKENEDSKEDNKNSKKLFCKPQQVEKLLTSHGKKTLSYLMKNKPFFYRAYKKGRRHRKCRWASIIFDLFLNIFRVNSKEPLFKNETIEIRILSKKAGEKDKYKTEYKLRRNRVKYCLTKVYFTEE